MKKKSGKPHAVRDNKNSNAVVHQYASINMHSMILKCDSIICTSLPTCKNMQSIKLYCVVEFVYTHGTSALGISKYGKFHFQVLLVIKIQDNLISV